MSRVISVDDIVISKSAAHAVFTVRLSEADPRAPVTVRWTLIGLTSANGDERDDEFGTLVFEPGVVERTISVSLASRRVSARTETLALIISSASANAVIGNTVAIATIIDCTAALGRPLVTVDDCVVDSSMREASFVVTLDRPSTSLVAMSYATQDAGAVAGRHYVATSGHLDFAPGETAKTVKVTLLDAMAAESADAFNLILSRLTGATTLDPAGTAIIAGKARPLLLPPERRMGDIVVRSSQSPGHALVPADDRHCGSWGMEYGTSGEGTDGDFLDHAGFLAPGPDEMLRTMWLSLTGDAAEEPSRRSASRACPPATPTGQRRVRASRQRRRSSPKLLRRAGRRWSSLSVL
ncbi:Calx-beta domain-containing protein [Accumulibacter sp.]|uniref:Calx-beta domain-containing protein n=1 Tax=Accumulibacter sp. TaxID=2053492 RepID=UPI0025F8EBD1|nr:Calx-beta domain-containing protein [Accumulibacter sp.]MCM8612773.1 hypothetical protein [Accumulibacter sp.]MCM8637577.1 hypothetical protein [Accumulibacter sp.]MCM8639706.1 hypothetical protein [Accumulibacter sp.]